MPRRGKSESSEQATLVSLVANFYPDAILAAVPNGGFRLAREAARLKAEGVRKGFPDLVLMEPRAMFHGAVIEMKRENGGALSEEQLETLKGLRDRGYWVIVGCGARDAFEQVEEYLRLTAAEDLLSQLDPPWWEE